MTFSWTDRTLSVLKTLEMSPYHCYSHWVYTFLCPLSQACRGGRFDYGVEMESTDAPNAPEVKPDEMRELIEQQVTYIVITVESLGST